MTIAAPRRIHPGTRAWTARWPVWAEVALFACLFVLYEWLRSLVAPTGAGIDRAQANAMDLVAIEEALGLYIEPAVHDWTQATPVAEFLTTWFYTLGYTGGFLAMFIWVWWRRRDSFAAFRNWFWAASFVAVLGYWAYPLAPPRLTGEGLADPTAETVALGGALDWFQPFRNEYAAMPSMHCGLAMLLALALFWLLRPSPWRWLALLWPVAMVFAVMATANHWWLDAVGGAVAVAIAFALVWPLTRSMPAPWRHRA